jgi:hypothetical protein
MAVGQVSFHNDKKVKRGTSIFLSIPSFPPSSVSTATLSSASPEAEILITVHVQTRDNAIVNRLNKTKVEKEVDHESDRQERLRLEGRKKKVEALERVCPSSFSIAPVISSYPIPIFSLQHSYLIDFPKRKCSRRNKRARELIL